MHSSPAALAPGSLAVMTGLALASLVTLPSWHLPTSTHSASGPVLPLGNVLFQILFFIPFFHIFIIFQNPLQ